MAHRCVQFEIVDQVAIVQIDNPPLNSLDTETKEEIFETFTELDRRRAEIRTVILRGAGEKAFAAGADIKGFLGLQPDTARRRLSRTHQIYAFLENFEWPTIAAIQGYCLGGGLELALCCDVRYAEQDAKFGFPEVNLSVFPGNGGTKRSFYNVPLGKLKELIYSGDIITAETALEIGLIEKVVPKGAVMEATLELAGKIKGKGPLGIAAAKKVLNRSRDLCLWNGLAVEVDHWSALTSTEDMKEGARAFLDRRKPVYRCR